MKHIALFAVALVATLTASATDVVVKTRDHSGQTLTFGINSGAYGSVRWADGTYKTFSSATNGGLISMEQVTDSFVIRTSKADITNLQIAGNQVVSLDLTDCANTLLTLDCSRNELTDLDLSACNKLRTLDCSGNSLTSLTTNSRLLTRLNCADNSLTSLRVTHPFSLTTLLCQNNQLTALCTNEMAELRTLTCQHNLLSSLDLTASPRLSRLVANDNLLTDIQMDTQSLLHDVWVDGNSLTQLNLAGASTLQSISCTDNRLSTITWQKACASTMRYLDVDGNLLFYNSLPTYYNKTSKTTNFVAHVGDQQAYHLTDNINMEEEQNWRDALNYNAFNALLSPRITMTDATGYVLQEGSDYTNSSRRFTFHHAFTGVVLTATSDLYPDVTLTCQPFDVIDLTGINGIRNEELEMRNDIYNLAGQRVSTMQQGRIYIINGKKVIK